MKLRIQCFLAIAALHAVNAFEQPADIFYHQQEHIGPSMWGFGQDVQIYAPDGSRVIKSLGSREVCGLSNGTCMFFDVQSDGHKYVWASQLSGTPRVDVFSITSGDYVTSIETCSTPLNLRYHPLREEMWVRCAENRPDAGQDGHMDVFSVNSLSADHQQVVLVDEGNLRAYGRTEIHASMGNFAYATSLDRDLLYKVDLSSKRVVQTFPMGNLFGAYDMAYSPVNRHLYIRARVCCTCGTPESDVESCGRGPGGPVTVTTGPSIGVNVTGVCGASCMGSRADTIGVKEFDTVSEQFVGDHNILEGTGLGAEPRASPDGDFIFLLPYDGGKNIRILKPGANGEKSTLLADIPANFANAGPTARVIQDSAVPKRNGRQVAVFAASTDNQVVLVDLSANPPRSRSMFLVGDASSESTGGRTRAVEWAVDTDFVWIGGSAASEQYILQLSPDGDINQARIVRTLTGVTSTQFLYVQNYMALRLESMIETIVRQRMAELPKPAPAPAPLPPTTTTPVDSVTQALTKDDDNDGAFEAISVAGLVVGAIALIVSFGTLTMVLGGAKPTPVPESSASNGKTKSTDDDGGKSLASKQVA